MTGTDQQNQISNFSLELFVYVTASPALERGESDSVGTKLVIRVETISDGVAACYELKHEKRS
jgi:F420-0:gamma-glutamyl ligase